MVEGLHANLIEVEDRGVVGGIGQSHIVHQETAEGAAVARLPVLAARLAYHRHLPDTCSYVSKDKLIKMDK